MAGEREGKFWLGMVVGAAAGAVSALLFAPKSGTEIRSDIGDTAKQAGRKAGEAWGDVKDRTVSMASSVKDKVQSAASKGGEMVASGRERIGDAVEAGKDAAEQKREELEKEMRDKDVRM